MLKDYGHIFQHDKSLAKKAQEVSNRIFDISEFLAKIGVAGTAPLKLTLAITLLAPSNMAKGSTRLQRDLLSESGYNVIRHPRGPPLLWLRRDI